jgi:hypothetical protein
VAQHLSQADTGAAAIIDSIRGVQVALTVTNGYTDSRQRQHSLTRFIPLPNMGLAHTQSCGDVPILGTALTATEITQADGTPAVNLTWSPATDETSGEKDVVSYVIWRKLSTHLTFGNPYLSVPAGSAAYIYTDAAVAHGAVYVYQLAAEDCTPALSSTTTSSSVTIP